MVMGQDPLNQVRISLAIGYVRDMDVGSQTCQVGLISKQILNEPLFTAPLYAACMFYLSSIIVAIMHGAKRMGADHLPYLAPCLCLHRIQ